MKSVIEQITGLWRDAMPKVGRKADDQVRADMLLGQALRREASDLLAVARAASNQPGPGSVRDHELWQHRPDCTPLECRCGLSAFRAALRPLLLEVTR